MRPSVMVASLFVISFLVSGPSMAQTPLKVAEVSSSVASEATSSQWEALAQRLGDVKQLKAAFTQTRWLGATGQTLTSTGTLELDHAGSFLWTQLVPFKQVVRLQGDTFSIQYEDEPAEVMTKATHPAVWAAAEMLAGVMRLDVETLTQHFTGTLKEDPVKKGSWTATLEPKEAHLKQLLGTVVVSGDTVVRAFTMTPNPENRTEMTLSDIEVVR